MRTLGRSVNRVLRRFGLEIRPVTRSEGIRTRRSSLSTKDRCIEFIGPSGVGKTTLLNELVNHLAGDWYFRRDLDVARVNQTPDRVDSKIHWRLLMGKTSRLEEAEISGFQKLQFLRYFVQVVLNDVKLSNGDLKKGFLLDGGLCQNFARELLGLEEKEFSFILSARALVFLKPTDAETVVRQIRERAIAGGRLVIHHHGKTDDELAALTEISASVFEALAVRAEAAGVPLRVIRAEDPLESKISALTEFEQRFIKGEVTVPFSGQQCA